MRRNVNAMFVNLARRSQVLVERQLELLDGAGTRGERPGPAGEPVQARPPGRPDAPQRREPAGAGRHGVDPAVEPAGRRWRRCCWPPPPRSSSTSGCSRDASAEVHVVGHAVGELVHLLAELLENATAFSRPDTDGAGDRPASSGRRRAGGDRRPGPRHGPGRAGGGERGARRARRPPTWRRRSGWASSWSATSPPGTASGCGCSAARAGWWPGRGSRRAARPGRVGRSGPAGAARSCARDRRCGVGALGRGALRRAAGRPAAHRRRRRPADLPVARRCRPGARGGGTPRARCRCGPRTCSRPGRQAAPTAALVVARTRRAGERRPARPRRRRRCR